MNKLLTALLATTSFALTGAALAANPPQTPKAATAPAATQPKSAATTGGDQQQDAAEAAYKAASKEARKTLHTEQAECKQKPGTEQRACMKAAQGHFQKTSREVEATHAQATGKPVAQPKDAKGERKITVR